MKRYLVLIMFLITIPLHLEGQTQVNSTREGLLSEQISGFKRLSDSLFNLHEDLYNGKLYTLVPDPANHPFFLDNSWVQGTVYFSGTFSDNEIIKYDLVTDNVIIMLRFRGASYPVSINRDVVREFYINGHHFSFLDDFQDREKDLRPGYYEVLYDGTTGLYVRWMKSKAISKLTLLTEYPLEIRCFLKKKGIYHLIRDNKDLINVLSDHKEEIRSYIKTNRLRFSPRNKENAVKVLAYFDSL